MRKNVLWFGFTGAVSKNTLTFQKAITKCLPGNEITYRAAIKSQQLLSKRNKAIKTLKAPNPNNVNRPIIQPVSLYANVTHKSDLLSAVKKSSHIHICVCIVSLLLVVHREAPETGFCIVIILMVASSFDKKARDDRNPISNSFSSALDNKNYTLFIVISF